MVYQRSEMFNDIVLFKHKPFHFRDIWGFLDHRNGDAWVSNLFLDFCTDICHHKRMIQKIEKWRIQELAQVLKRLSILMQEGKNSDWGSVFSHYAHEAQNIVGHRTFDMDALRRLSNNIVNCFAGGSSLRNLVLLQKEPINMDALNQEFRETIRLLFTILGSFEEKWKEPIH
jgi:hypothetical protein